MNARSFRPALTWPNAFSVLMLLVLLVVYFSRPADLDYCWQIRNGERMIDSGRIVNADTYSYTIHGKELPDHEWLYEVLLALVWRGLGDHGLKLMRVLLFSAPLFILAWQLSRRGVRRHGLALTLLSCTLVFFYFERLRPMVCSTIGLQLVAGWLHDHCHGRRRLDARLPLTMLLWGNLHPAVIMGQALLVGALCWEWFAYWRRPETSKGIVRGLTLWGGGGFLAALVAPDPVGRFLYPFAPELRHPAQRLFQEIRPPWHYLGQYPHVLDFALLLAVFFGVVLIVRWREFRGWEWGLLLGVAGLAATATRATVDWLVITAALAVPQIGPVLRDLASPRRRLGRFLLTADRALKKIFQGPFLRPQPIWPAVFAASLSVLAVLPPEVRQSRSENPLWPTEAVDWIASRELPSPQPWNIFSGSDDGTYLLWRLRDRVRVYTDTRGFYYPGDLLMDSYYLPDADAQWPERLERAIGHGSQYFLLRVDSNLWRLLEAHTGAPLYRDEKVVLLSTAQVSRAAARALPPSEARDKLARRTP